MKESRPYREQLKGVERDIKYKRNIEVKAYPPKNNTIFVMVDEVSSFGFRRINVTNMSPNIFQDASLHLRIGFI